MITSATKPSALGLSRSSDTLAQSRRRASRWLAVVPGHVANQQRQRCQHHTQHAEGEKQLRRPITGRAAAIIAAADAQRNAHEEDATRSQAGRQIGQRASRCGGHQGRFADGDEQRAAAARNPARGRRVQ
jgi:hypothetical protein